MDKSKILGYIPTVIESSARGENSFDIFSRMLRERIIFLGEEIDDEMANSIVAQLLILDAENPEKDIMMYPFMTLKDDTEITHSEMNSDGKVKVYIETPDEKYCFKHATCWLPEYKWEDIFQYSEDEIHHFDEIIHSMAHLIMEFSQEGGFDNASNF